MPKNILFFLFLLVLSSLVSAVEISKTSGNSFFVTIGDDSVFDTSKDYIWTGSNIFNNLTVINYTGINIVNRSDYWGTYHYTELVNYCLLDDNTQNIITNSVKANHFMFNDTWGIMKNNSDIIIGFIGDLI